MITEEEAKTKACFRAATFGASQQLADGPGPHCIASACMAWRWTERRGDGPVQEKLVKIGEGGPDVLPPTPGHKWYGGTTEGEFVRWGLFPLTGYCGLAGKP